MGSDSETDRSAIDCKGEETSEQPGYDCRVCAVPLDVIRRKRQAVHGGRYWADRALDNRRRERVHPSLDAQRQAAPRDRSGEQVTRSSKQSCRLRNRMDATSRASCRPSPDLRCTGSAPCRREARSVKAGLASDLDRKMRAAGGRSRRTEGPQRISTAPPIPLLSTASS